MITAELMGRLGNQMFQYALCRIIANKNGYNFYLSREDNSQNQNVCKIFNLDNGIYDGPILYEYKENIDIQIYDENIFNIKNYTRLCGFFQSEKYFTGYENDIIKWYNIILDSQTKDILNEFNINEYCYIHFRGSDYKSLSHFLPKEYYYEAMQYIKNINRNIKFLIITEDIETAKNYFNHPIISNKILTDFKLLYFSKTCIIPNSSFSWWASWLSNKNITIAPNKWFNYNDNAQITFKPIDIKSCKFTYI